MPLKNLTQGGEFAITPFKEKRKVAECTDEQIKQEIKKRLIALRKAEQANRDNGKTEKIERSSSKGGKGKKGKREESEKGDVGRSINLGRTTEQMAVWAKAFVGGVLGKTIRSVS